MAAKTLSGPAKLHKADVLDWDDLRFFLAVARHGSLTAATKELGVAQSTVGRRLASLEASLSARLLLRTPEGYKLTLAGESVKAQAERVEAEALTLERTVGGQDEKLQGVVRVTCTETLAVHVLVIDHVEGDTIKLKKMDPASGGQHHLIMVSSVALVAAKVMLKTTAKDAMARWTAAN